MDETIIWLMNGDVSVQYMTHKCYIQIN